MKILEEVLTVVFSTLEGIADMGLDMFESLVRGTPKRKEKYDADFGTPRSLLSPNNTGFRFGHLALSRQLSFEGIYVSGGPGSGKTVNTVINSILTAHNASLVINDVSGEIFKLTSGYLKSEGYE
ncbi:hypothetical protein COB64_04315, partial [Candidatus Wolfebacteria bacterium]